MAWELGWTLASPYTKILIITWKIFQNRFFAEFLLKFYKKILQTTGTQNRLLEGVYETRKILKICQLHFHKGNQMIL
jgi:hypothetical protein